MTSFSITIVRHGETSYNKDGIIQGQTDIPLSETGHLQAGLVAERLKHCSFTHAFTSDLARANQTAEAIMKENKVCQIDLQRDKRLRERKFGEFEGKTVQDLRAKAKEVIGPTRSWTEYNPLGAETYNQLQDRASAFFRELCSEVLSSVDNSGGPDSTSMIHNVNERHRSVAITDLPKEENGFEDKHVKRRKQDCEITKIQSNNVSNPKSESEGKCTIKDKILPNFRDMPHRNEELAVSTKRRKSKDGEEEEDGWITFEEENKDTRLDSERNGKLDLIEDSNNSSTNKSSIRLSSSVPNLSEEESKKTKMSSMKEDDSIDDRDSESCLAANVLLVSHGGFIKELLKYFTQGLGCELPGGNNLAFRICQNCSISKFIVAQSQDVEMPSIKCLYLNKKDHLKGMGDAIGHY